MSDMREPEDTLAELLARAAPVVSELGVVSARERAREALLGRAPQLPRLGRFEVVSELGAGGMGTVYAAFDPKLQRSVALKVVEFDELDDPDRMLHEARAMAALSHPNVVSIYEAEVLDRLLVIAMELVHGTSLRAWLDRRRRDDDVLAMFLRVGEGLQAAHDAGLVHGDFKPSNVIVEPTGRPRILDFGLANRVGTEPAPCRGGTPGYVAPELVAGAAPSAATDLYAFAVSLGRSLDKELQLHGVPRWLRGIIGRGIAAEPERRFGSMGEMLDALRTAARRRRRRRRGAAVVAAALAAIAAPLVVVQATRNELDPCSGGHPDVSNVWRWPQRDAIALGPRTPHLPRWLALMDHQTDAVHAAYGSACRATYVDREQSEALFDRQMVCMGAISAQLAANVESALSGEPLESSLVRLAEIQTPDSCLDTAALLELDAPPASLVARARIERVHELMAEATLHTHQARFDRSLEVAQQAVRIADQAGYGPIQARAYMGLGLAHENREEYERAEAAYIESRTFAIAARDNRTLVLSLSRLSNLLSAKLDRPDEAATIVAMAESFARRGADLVARSYVLLSKAELANARGHADAALQIATQMLSNLAGEPADTMVTQLRVAAHNLMFASQYRSGRWDDAAATLRALMELNTERFGPTHPVHAGTYINLAVISYRKQDLEQAKRRLAKARALLDSTSEFRTKLGQLLNMKGLIHYNLAEYDEAEEAYREAIAVHAALHGRDDQHVWAARNNLANLLGRRAKWDEAIEIYEEHLIWVRRTRGETDARTLLARINVANAHVEGHETIAGAERALVVIDPLITHLESVDPRAAMLSNAYAVRARAQQVLGLYDPAVRSYQQALAIGTGNKEIKPRLIAHLHQMLGFTLLQAGRLTEARAAARRAVSLWRALPGGSGEQPAREVEAWLAANRG